MLNYLNNYIKILKQRSLPSWLTFFVTNKCNLSCRHCFYSKNINKNINELSLEEIKKTSFSLNEITKLFIGGGEPFLRDDLKEICESFYEQNNTRLIYIPTNGLLKDRIETTTRYILEKCRHCTLTLTFSLEGTKTINDTVRGEGSFEKTIDNLHYFCKLKPELKRLRIVVSSAISNFNCADILNLFEYLKNNTDIDYHTYDPIRNLAHSADQFLELSPENWEKLVQKSINFDKYYFNKMGQKKMKLIAHILAKEYIYLIQKRSLEYKHWPFRCRAGSLFGVIEPDGNVMVCELIRNAIGNLRDAGYNFKLIWFSERAKALRKQISENKIEACRNCANGCCCLVPSLLTSPIHLLKAITGLYH